MRTDFIDSAAEVSAFGRKSPVSFGVWAWSGGESDRILVSRVGLERPTSRGGAKEPQTEGMARMRSHVSGRWALVVLLAVLNAFAFVAPPSITAADGTGADGTACETGGQCSSGKCSGPCEGGVRTDCNCCFDFCWVCGAAC